MKCSISFSKYVPKIREDGLKASKESFESAVCGPDTQGDFENIKICKIEKDTTYRISDGFF